MLKESIWTPRATAVLDDALLIQSGPLAYGERESSYTTDPTGHKRTNYPEPTDKMRSVLSCLHQQLGK